MSYARMQARAPHVCAEACAVCRAHSNIPLHHPMDCRCDCCEAARAMTIWWSCVVTVGALVGVALLWWLV